MSFPTYHVQAVGDLPIPQGFGGLISGTVSTFANLPTPAVDYQGKVYFVSEASGGLLSILNVYKYPKGLYSPNTSNVWELVPFNVKVSEDSTTLVNITNWAEFLSYYFDIGIGDMLIYNGIQYVNLTGTQTSTAPDTDTTNWETYKKTFLDQSDTPSSYSHQAGKFTQVNEGEDAIEFRYLEDKDFLFTAFNKIINPSFSEGTGTNADDWIQHASYTRVDTLHHTGEFSMLNTCDGSVHTCTQTFNVKPRSIYKISGWVYIPTISGESASTVAIDLNDIDGEPTVGFSTATKDEWQYQEELWDSREYSELTIRLLTNGTNSATPQLVYWDDIQVQCVGVGTSVVTKTFEADMFEPANSSFPITTNAPLQPDPTTGNGDKSVIVFDDTAARAVGFTITIPNGATNIVLRISSKPQSTGGGTIIPRLYTRQTTPNAAEGSWSSTNTLSSSTFPANTNPQLNTRTIALSTLSLTAGLKTKFLLARLGAGETLVGNWLVGQIEVFFT